MFWQEDENIENKYTVPDDVFDLVFRLQGSHLAIDHAYALAQVLQETLGEAVCNSIGVHGVRMAGSGNGWNRPEQDDASLPLSRRARLVIRVHSDVSEAVQEITHQTLQIGGQQVTVGECKPRELSTLGTLHASAVQADREQPEDDFLAEVAQMLKQMDISVSKMMCGKSRNIRTNRNSIFARALLIAGLRPEEAVSLQREGIGKGRLLGCGLFVPHRGIDPVYRVQE